MSRTCCHNTCENRLTQLSVCSQDATCLRALAVSCQFNLQRSCYSAHHLHGHHTALTDDCYPQLLQRRVLRSGRFCVGCCLAQCLQMLGEHAVKAYIELMSC